MDRRAAAISDLLKSIIFYFVLLNFLAIIIGILLGTPLGNFIAFTIVVAGLVQVGRKMHSKALQRKYFVYLGIIMVEFAIYMGLVAMFDLRREYPLVNLIISNIIIITIIIMLFDMAKTTKYANNTKVTLILRIISTFMIVTVVGANISAIIYLF